MYNPYGLEAWEVVAASGVVAMLILAVASMIGFTLAWVALGERRVVRHTVSKPAMAVPNEPRAEPARAPEFAPTTPSAA